MRGGRVFYRGGGDSSICRWHKSIGGAYYTRGAIGVGDVGGVVWGRGGG